MIVEALMGIGKIGGCIQISVRTVCRRRRRIYLDRSSHLPRMEGMAEVKEKFSRAVDRGSQRCARGDQERFRDMDVDAVMGCFFLYSLFFSMEALLPAPVRLRCGSKLRRRQIQLQRYSMSRKDLAMTFRQCKPEGYLQ